MKTKQKFAGELEKKTFNIYNIKILWKQSFDLNLILSTNSQEKLSQLFKL